jgi:hypothetical protein
MINISTDSQDNILIVNFDGTLTVYTCQVSSLPDDFFKYLGAGKYLANAQGLYIKSGWTDYNALDIPTSPIIDYTMTSACPVTGLTRHVYWQGEDHVLNTSININLMILHFNSDGSRNRTYDGLYVLTAQSGTMINNPLTNQPIDQYEFFLAQSQTVPLPQLIELGIQMAVVDGRLNNIINYILTR